MFLKNKMVQLAIAILIGALIYLLPRPVGTQFRILGDPNQTVLAQSAAYFHLLKSDKTAYVLELDPSADLGAPDAFLAGIIADRKTTGVQVDYVNGMTPKAKRLLAMLAVLVFLFVIEPIPLEITAILIGVALIGLEISTVSEAWAPYMHPVVVFIMCCLILAIAFDKAGLTKRLGYFIISKAGTNLVRCTFVISISLGLASGIMHDAAACSIGIVVLLPMLRAVNVAPNSNTAKFVMLSIAFACSCGGMGTLVGGGRCMVSAAFLKELTGMEITFFDWIKYAMPAALVTVPAAVTLLYFIFRPDTSIQLPKFEDTLGAWSPMEKRTTAIIVAIFAAWLTKGVHGLDYSVTGMLGITALILCKVLTWEDIHTNLEWGTALFIFGGGLSLGLAMDKSGAAAYFAHLIFPLVKGGGWLALFLFVAVFGALVTNVMANVAAAALLLPIVIPVAQLEGVNPTILALCLGMATSFAMLLVIGCPPNAIAYSYRYFKSSDLTKAGALVMPVLLLILFAIAALWWRILGLI